MEASAATLLAKHTLQVFGIVILAGLACGLIAGKLRVPDVAILFNDTQLRMKDKLVVMFEEELKRRYGKKSRTDYPVNRLVEELFEVKNRIFIINSRKDIAENFAICLRHYLRSIISASPQKSYEKRSHDRDT